MIFFVIVAVWNVIVAIVYGVDKFKAKSDSWRISEKCLMLLALCFGAFGALLGMSLFHHKTLKPKFRFGVPCFAILNAVAFWAVWHFVM